ncbi:MAG: DEAD/DEAH box helicase family protein [Deltaproteobacteria bacterium]|nr:DEAD/DEAH box helicase family protein [Deltaproteobacteria bacterium]
MDDHQDLQTQLQAALAECERLRDEITLLKEVIVRHSIPLPEPKREAAAPRQSEVSEARTVTAPPSPEAKIALFRELFRGREDVYAERWESEDGRSGYAPASKKDWEALLASKPKDRQKVHRRTRKLLPLTDQVFWMHLAGKKTVGIYPLLTDETCWLLAADFDKKTWQDDATAFLVTCRKTGVPAYLERSRSGNGGHVWIFFERAIPAVLARKMGCAILTQTMERRHQLGLDSYDRFFPNQDTLPKGGFGNLIALPLQKIPRENGNSVFIDDNSCPYPEQWQFLASIRRVAADHVEWIVKDAARNGQIVGVHMSVPDEDSDEEPWTLPPSRKRAGKPIQGPFPEHIELVQSNLVYVPKAGLPEPMMNRMIRIAAFQNPEFYKAQAMRLSTWDKPRVIFCGEDLSRHVALPRGCLQVVRELLEEHGIRVTTRDERCTGKPIDVTFRGELRDEQVNSARQILQHEEGILCAPTAFGKTVVGAKLIAERKVSTLLLVHRRQLLDQWRERLAMFLHMPEKAIGQIGGGKFARTGVIDVAVIQSLQRKGEVKDFVAEYGQVIVDECHHISAFTFEQVMRQVKARYVVGLTATPTRKDGHHPIIFMQCGPIRFALSVRKAAERSPLQHLLLPRPTDFRMLAETTDLTIHDIYAALVVDAARNQQIIKDILEAVCRGLTPLVLTNRTDHLERLALGLSSIENVLILKGGMGQKKRQSVADRLNEIPDGVPRVILATGSYISEGFDDSRLDTLFLTMPISWRGTLQQYVGRLHRIHHDKRVVRVYDYVDAQVPMLARMYDKRLRGYRAIGYVLATESQNDLRL